MGKTVMPFGKYKGEKLENVDVDYLEWVLVNFKGNYPLTTSKNSVILILDT